MSPGGQGHSRFTAGTALCPDQQGLPKCPLGTQTNGHRSLPSAWPPRAVGSACDLKPSQAELYLDTRARVDFWGEEMAAHSRAPGEPLISACVTGRSPDQGLLAPTSPKKLRKDSIGTKEASWLGVCVVCVLIARKNKFRASWSAPGVGQRRGAGVKVGVFQAAPCWPRLQLACLSALLPAHFPPLHTSGGRSARPGCGHPAGEEGPPWPGCSLPCSLGRAGGRMDVRNNYPAAASPELPP